MNAFVNCGDVGDKSKKNRRQGSGFDLICFEQMISGLTSLRYRRLRLYRLQLQLQRASTSTASGASSVISPVTAMPVFSWVSASASERAMFTIIVTTTSG